MSKASYRYKVRQGIAGEDHNICVLAAAEIISPQSIPAPIYPEAEEFLDWFSALADIERFRAVETYVDFLENSLRPLGVRSWEELHLELIVSARQLGRSLLRLTSKGYRPLIGLDLNEETHAVGILPGSQDGLYRAESSWKPRALYGEFTPSTLFRLISLPLGDTKELRGRQIPNHPINFSNLTALPPTA